MSLKYWVWLSTMTQLKPSLRYELIRAFGGPEALFHVDDKGLSEKIRLTPSEKSAILNTSLDAAEEILGRCHEDGITILTLNDAAYPERLRNIYDPPATLYIKGRLPAMDEEAAIAIVGTRKASPYGIKMARSCGYDIARGGGLVVTGLAEGVDSASAEGALRAGGSCIGVLGCAIDYVYPANNTALYSDVSAVGALVSEYPPGTEIDRKFFPERNRIMSGLSVGVLVIEAPAVSGSLITASRALEQGREVFAVPGPADAPNCKGSNGLIKDGAMLAQSGRDVLSEFSERFPKKLRDPDKERGPLPPDGDEAAVYPAARAASLKNGETLPETGKGFLKLRVKNERKKVDKQEKPEYIDLREQLKTLTEAQLKIVSAIDERSKHVDDIIEATGLSVSAVLSELTLLEIKGFVTQESGKRFTLNISQM